MAVAKIASIIAKKRAADIAKKKVAKVSDKEARNVSREMSQRVGGSKGITRPRGSGNLQTRPSNVPRNTTVKKITKVSPDESSRRKREGVQKRKERGWSSLQNPPKAKSTKRQPILLTKKIPTRNEMLGAKKVVKYRGQNLILSPGQINKLRGKTSSPKSTIFERDYNLKSGEGLDFQKNLDKQLIARNNQIEKEGRTAYLRQMRDSIINPKKVLNPNKMEKSWESDRRAAAAVREAERLRKIASKRKFKKK